MPTPPAALRTPAAQNLLAAVTAGATVLARPARFPKWARRSLSLANTAGTAGSVLLGQKQDASGTTPKLGLAPTRTTSATTASASSALAAATGGVTLITSRLGLKADAKVENYLLGKGIKHPRIWMAIAVVGVVFAVKTIQDYASSKVDDKAKEFVAAKQGQPGAPAPEAAPGLIPEPTGVAPHLQDSAKTPDHATTPAADHAAAEVDEDDIAEDTGRPVADPADS